MWWTSEYELSFQRSHEEQLNQTASPGSVPRNRRTGCSAACSWCPAHCCWDSCLVALSLQFYTSAISSFSAGSMFSSTIICSTGDFLQTTQLPRLLEKQKHRTSSQIHQLPFHRSVSWEWVMHGEQSWLTVSFASPKNMRMMACCGSCCQSLGWELFWVQGCHVLKVYSDLQDCTFFKIPLLCLQQEI